MLEELSGPGVMPTNGDFPPSAMSLMYSPPMDTEGDNSEDDVDGHEDADEWMTPFIDDLNGGDKPMRPITPRTRPASPGLALLASSPGDFEHEDTEEFSSLPPASLATRDYTGLSTPSTASSAHSHWREGKQGVRRSPSAPPSAPRSMLGGCANRNARSATPSSTTPRRCAGDAGDVQPSLGPPYDLAGQQPLNRLALQGALDDPWLAAQMNFRGRKCMFGDELSSNPDAGAATIATLMRCIKEAQGLPEQQKPNSEKWTERWAQVKLDSKDVL